MNKRSLAVFTCTCILAGNTALAQEGGLFPGKLMGNIALSSEYVARGVSQTDRRPAVQGGIDWIYEAEGFTPYIGAWASQVGGERALGIPGADYELDLYAATVFSFHGLDLDLGFIRYVYPGEHAPGYNPNYLETKIALGYTIAEFIRPAISYNYSPDYSGTGYVSHYIQGELTVAPPEFPLGLSFTGSIGRSLFGGELLTDYTDWSLGAGIEVEGINLSVTYTDTDMDETACSKLCSARLVGKVHFAF